MALLVPRRASLRREALVAGAILAFWNVLSPGAAADARHRVFDEVAVKSVFVLNFTRFVEWPAEAFAGADAPLIVGILGEDALVPTLEQMLRGETAHGREIVVRRYQRVAEVGQCQLLFISRSQSRDLERIFLALDGRPILTVSDVDEFGHRGGMMRLYAEDNRMRLQVNLQAVRSAGLTVSSNLLRVAEVVDREVAP